MKGILQTEILLDLMVDGRNCQSSALDASTPGSPQKAPCRDTGAVEGSKMPVTPQDRPELLGMGDPALWRRLPARKEWKEERKRRRQMGSDGNIS